MKWWCCIAKGKSSRYNMNYEVYIKGLRFWFGHRGTVPSICGQHKATKAAMYCTGAYRGLAFKLLFVALDVFFDVNTIITLILSSTLAIQTTNPNERVQSAWDSLLESWKVIILYCEVQFLDAFQFAVPNFLCIFLEEMARHFLQTWLAQRILPNATCSWKRGPCKSRTENIQKHKIHIPFWSFLEMKQCRSTGICASLVLWLSSWPGAPSESGTTFLGSKRRGRRNSPRFRMFGRSRTSDTSGLLFRCCLHINRMTLGTGGSPGVDMVDATHEVGGGVGWGGDDNVLCTCTHGWCYATSCFLHLHTWSVLRNTMGWVGVGMITFFSLAHMVGATQHHVSCTCTHGRCYATPWGGLGWGW